MVSKNNQWQHLQASAQRVPHYGLRKLSVGVASVLLSTTLYMGVNAHADTVGTPSGTGAPAETAVTGSSAAVTETTSGAPASGSPASGTPASQVTDEKPVVGSSAGGATAGVQPESTGTTPTSGATSSQSSAVQPANTPGTASAAVSGGTTDQTGGDQHTPAQNQTTLNATFKWAIHYTDETGKKLVPDSVITHDYTRTDTGDQMGNWSYVPDSVKVTGTPNAGWNISNPTFKFDQTAGGTMFDFANWQAAAASIDGYTPNYGSVALTDQLPKNPESLHATETVDSGLHEFTFVYTKQPTNVIIDYVDDEQGEKVVGTGTVSGKSGAEVTITPSLPKGYMLTPDKDVPSTYTVTDDANQVVTIHVQKQFVDLSDTDPQAKQTRTVTLHYVYGTGDKQGQPAFDDAVLDVYYHRTATLDRATNETTYGDWLWDQSQGDPSTPGYHVVSGKWTNLPQSWANVTADVPSINGWYADLGQNDPTNTNHVPANTWVFPTYNNAGGAGHTVDGHGATAYLDGQGYEVGPTHTIKYMPNQTTITVNYVDDDNNGTNVGHQSWNGSTGQHIDLTLTPPENYVLTPGWVNPSSYDFDGVNSAWYTVHVKHATQDVTDQQPKDQVTKVTRLTRNHLYGDGPHKGEKFGEPDIFDLAWKRTATKDLVTNKVTLGDWQFDRDNSKNVQGSLRIYSDNSIGGALRADHNGYSYLGRNAHLEFSLTDGSTMPNTTYDYGWYPAQALKYSILNVYYGPDQVKIPIYYVDADSNQQVGQKVNGEALTGDDFRDGNTVTIDQSKLTSLPTTLTGYQLLPGQTLPTSYKIDTFAGVKAIEVQVVKDRSVKVTFVDDDNKGAVVGTPTTITGHTGGDPVALDLTVPDKYELADGQQLPTSYTFTKGSGNVTVHLKHQIVQREATTNVYMFETPYVDVNAQALIAVFPKDQWDLIGKDNDGYPDDFDALKKKLGMIRGHVNYDLVTNQVTSVVDDWTNLNLQDQTFSVPTADVVVNGIVLNSEGDTGKTMLELMKENNWQGSFADYLKYPFKAYLSQQLTKSAATEGGPAFSRAIVPELVPGGFDQFANERGDATGSAFKLTEPINRSYLEKHRSLLGWKSGDSNDFRDQNGQLVSDSLLQVSYVYVPYIEKAVTRTIDVVKPDRTKQQVVQKATLDKAVSLSTPDKQKWSTVEWANYDAPTIPGYTPSQSNVAKETVTGTTEDQTINITYTANPQTTTVVYQTEDGTPVHTTTVDGQTGQTVKVPNEVPTGWHIVDGEVPSELIFGPDGTPQTVVTIAHSHVTVTPDAPKTTSDKLPDNPGKTYPAGVGESDLSKTVTRTINISKPDGSKTTEVQSAKLTRTATVDEVTGKVEYGDWSTGQWNTYKVPSLKGYTPTQSTVDKATVTGTTKDQTVNVTYNASQQTLTIRFIDEDLDNDSPDDYLVQGHVLTELDRTITGKTGESFNLNIAIPDHYVFDSTTPVGKKIPQVVAFTPDHGPEVDGEVPFYSFIQNNLVLVPLRHQQIDVSDQHPETKFTSTLTVHQVVSARNGTASADIKYLLKSHNIGPDYVIITFWRHQFMKDAVTGVVKDMGVVADTTEGDTKTPGMTLIGDWQYMPNATSNALKLKFKVIPGLTLNLSGPDRYETDPVVWYDSDDHGSFTATNAYHIVTDANGIAEISDFKGFDVNSRSFLGQYDPQKGQNAFAYIIYGSLPQKATVHVIDDDFAEHKTDRDLSIDYSWNNMDPETAFSEHPDYRTLSDLAFAGYKDLIWDRNHDARGNFADKSKLPVYVTTDGDYYIQPDAANEYTVHVRHKHSKVSADQSIPDFTTSKYDNLLNGIFGDGDGTPLRYDGLDESDLNKVVTRTIIVVNPIDGTKQTINQVAHLTRSADVDEATTEVKYDPWVITKWETYQVPTINGYTPSQNQVNETIVTDATEDQMVKVTYTANSQVVHVNYVDDSGTVIHTTTVDGVTDQTVPVPTEVPAGWLITKGEVPSELTFGADGHDSIEVTVGHRHVTVTPDQSQNNGVKLPDNPAKTFNGVEASDLNKTVTRTIKVTTPDGQTKTITQTAKLTRTADVDEVTGEVTYGKWTTGQWNAYEVPVLNGYTASQTSVEAAPVDENMKDQTVEVSYTPNKQSTTIKYVDDKGDVVHTTTVTGVTDQTVKVPSEVPAGWMVTKGKVSSEIIFGADGHEPIEVTVAHQHVTVDSDHPQNNGTNLPDNPAKTFEGVEANDLNKIITRTIKVTTSDGKATTTKQTVKLTRTADVDEVTGEVTYGKWTTGQWNAYEVPALNGYTASQTSVEATPVDENAKDQTVEVRYTPNSQSTTIKYVDDKCQTIHTTTVNGVTNQTVKVPSEVPAGWTIIKGKVPSEIAFGADGHEPIEVTIVHQHVTVTPDHPQDNGTKLPDNPAKTFNGVEASDLNKTITRTIKVTTPDGQTKTVVQTATLTRTADVDEVTGEVTYGDWTTGEWAAYDAPSVAGYVPSQTTVDKETVMAASKDTVITITYTPTQHQISVEYVDDDNHGKVVKTDQVSGKTDQTIAITPSAPANYDLVDDGNHTHIVTSADGQTVQIHVKHRQVTTTEDKTVIRTINVHTPHDGIKTIKQTVDLNRKVTTDQATGEKTYGDWTTGQWKAYTPEAIPGYTSSANEVPSANVDGSASDQTLEVTYTADPQTVAIVYVDDVKDGAVVKTDQVAGKTDETVKVTPVVLAGYQVVGEVLGSYTMTADGHQTITVHLTHQTKTTSESKTVTRTINVHTPHDGVKVVKQTAELMLNVTTDQVTGEKTYGDWTTGKWASYNVPAVAGYVPSIKQVAQQVVNGNTADQTIEVTYSSGEHTTHINYVDGDGNTVHTTTIMGQTDGTSQVPNETPAGWTVVGEPVPTELTFGPDGHTDVTVTISHKHVTVTSDQPKTSTDKLSDNPGKTYPSGVGHDDLNKTITRTIKITMPDGQTKVVAQTAKLTRTADVDEVTGQVTYGDWTTDEWAAYDAPSVAGYTPSQAKVDKETVTSASKDTTTMITYLPTQHQISVEYVDDDDRGKVVKTDQVPGKTDQTIAVTPSAPVNYDLVGNGDHTYIVTSGDGQAVQIHVKHHQVTTSESKIVTRTINVHTPHDDTKAVKQTATLTRDVTTDQATGEKTYGDWTTGQWKAYTPEAIPGYTSSANEVPSANVDGSASDQAVEVTYTADPQTVEIVYLDDAKDGAVVKTDQVAGKTDETVKVTPVVPAGYQVVGEVPGSYTMTADGHQTMTVHLTHQTKTTSEDKTVMRTINVHTPHDGVRTVKQTATLTRAMTTDQVTGEKTYGEWSATLWDHYAVPAVAGYVPSIKQVAQQVVNGTITDQTIDVTYSSGEHTTHINYVGGDGNIVHTTTIKGQTDGTSQVPNEVPAGWTVVGKPVPTELTFGPDGHTDVTVTVDHQHVTVTPDQPKTSADKLPDNPAKTYPNGVSHDDLNKTVTRTVKVTTPDGQTKTTEQTAKLTRTADVDEVTGEVTYGKWTTGEWANYEVPTVPGYTASQSEVPATKVTSDTKNQRVTVTYTANDQTTHVTYVDGNGNTVHTTTVTGKTDQTVKVPNETPAGWTITDGQVPAEITFGFDGHADVTVTVVHQHVTVTSDKPQTDGTKLPDNPSQTFHGVGHDDLNKTITRTIEVTTPDGQTKTTEQTVKLTRTADVDEATGEVTYGNWATGEWTAYNVPTVPGYIASQSEVPATKVTIDTKNQTVKITYTADRHMTHINYVDEHGDVVHTATVTGQTDQTVKVPNEVPAGWTITKGRVPSEVTFGADGNDDVTIIVDHQHVTVTSDDPKSDGTPLPDNPALTFHGVEHSDLNKTITRTIKVTMPDGQTKTTEQTVKLTRTADIDEVTGDVTYGDWSTGAWAAYQVSTVPGYTASQTTVPVTTVTAVTDDQAVTITYTADIHATHINYVDEHGNVVHTTMVTGHTDQTVKVPNETPAGWMITAGEVPSEVTFGADGHIDVTITVDHQYVTVTADDSKPDGTPLPDNPTLTFTGVGEADLNKTITRTITFNVPGRDPQVITQTTHLTRTATVDEVTGEVTYGDWTTGQWDAYAVPTVDGYTADQTMIPAVNVTSETTGQAVTVDYVAVSATPTTSSEQQPTTDQATALSQTPAANGTVQKTNQNTKQLPQTGNDNRAGLLSLIGGSLMASLAVLGLNKKRKTGEHKQS